MRRRPGSAWLYSEEPFLETTMTTKVPPTPYIAAAQLSTFVQMRLTNRMHFKRNMNEAEFLQWYSTQLSELQAQLNHAKTYWANAPVQLH
jgi:hypothetical protein